MSEIDHKATLIAAYDAKVAEREAGGVQDWKWRVRETFLQYLLDTGSTSVLEVGAGTGEHGRYLADHGREVVSTDFTPAMVTACRDKGLRAEVMDFTALTFDDASFDAVFSLNCYLHATPDKLPAAVSEAARVLKLGGLFYWGQYGGDQFTGELPGDNYDPPRYFSFVDDATMQSLAGQWFDPVVFESFAVSAREGFQSGIWRKR